MTLEEAKRLKIGDILHHLYHENADGTPERWRVNGKVKTWKRSSKRILVPIKHGLRGYGHLTQNSLHLLDLA
jgi:hypothetical protein